MLNSITLENFQKHASLEVEFNLGTSLVVGDNWAGKTTLVRAVLYSLFGPSVIPGGMKILVPRGTNKKPKTTLNFTVNGNQYELQRGHSCWLKKDGQKIASGQSIVSSEVEKILGLSSKMFYALRYAPQDEVGSILTLGAGRLNEIVDQITQSDIIDKVISQAGFSSAKLQGQIEGAEVQDVDALKDDVSNRQARLLSDHQEMSRKSEELPAMEQAVSEAKTQWKERYSQRQNYLHRTDLQHSLTVQRDQNKEKLSRLKKPNPLGSEVQHEQAQAQLDGLLSLRAREDIQWGVLSSLKKERDRAVSLRENNKKIVQGLADRASSMDLSGLDNLPALEESLEQLNYEWGAANSKVKDIEKSLENSICRTCLRPFDRTQEELDRLHESLNKLRNSMTSLQEQMEEKRVEVRNLQHLKVSHEELASKIRYYRESIGRSNEEIKEAEEKISLQEDKVKGFTPREEFQRMINEQRQRVEDEKDAWSRTILYEKEFELLHHNIQSIEKEVSELVVGEEVREKEVQDKEQEWKTREQEAETARHQVFEMQGQYRAHYAEFQAAEQALARAQEAGERVKKAQQKQILIGLLIRYLRTHRDEFMAQIWERVLSLASSFASEATNGRVLAVRRDPSGGFTYREDDHWAPVAAASGFQRAAIGVGVRLALAAGVRTAADVLLLDEATAGATDENSIALTAALAATGLQVVSVTHRTTDSCVADQVIQI